MDRRLRKPLLIACCILLLAAAWFWGYHSRKSMDNIPSPEILVSWLQEQGEDYASEQLEGYTLEQLTYVWGEPDGNLFGMFGYIWESGEDHYVVYFDSDQKVTGVKLGDRANTP